MSDETAVLRLIRALEEFRKLDPEMPVQTVLTFLNVAAKEGLSGTELAARVDLSSSSISRNITAFAQVNRFKKPGYDLLDYREDTLGDARRKVVTLNARGRTFLERVLSPWRN